jgi:hypothetical protein
MSCGCNKFAPVAEEVLSDNLVLSDAATVTGTRCEDFAAQKRANLEQNPTPNPGLRPRRVSSFRKLDPCNEVEDVLTRDLRNRINGVRNGFGRVPSLFTANNDREAAALNFTLGWIDQLGDTSQIGKGPSTLGIGGSAATKFVGQLATKSLNFNQRPYRWCRQPSVFTCDNAACQSALSVELGFTNSLNDQENRDLNSGFTKGLGGGRGPGDKTFEQQNIRVTRFGNTSAGL